MTEEQATAFTPPHHPLPSAACRLSSCLSTAMARQDTNLTLTAASVLREPALNKIELVHHHLPVVALLAHHGFPDNDGPCKLSDDSAPLCCAASISFTPFAVEHAPLRLLRTRLPSTRTANGSLCSVVFYRPDPSPIEYSRLQGVFFFDSFLSSTAVYHSLINNCSSSCPILLPSFFSPPCPSSLSSSPALHLRNPGLPPARTHTLTTL